MLLLLFIRVISLKKSNLSLLLINSSKSIILLKDIFSKEYFNEVATISLPFTEKTGDLSKDTK